MSVIGDRRAPQLLQADVLAYPATSFGYLTSSALGRLLVNAGGPRVEQSIVSKRPLRLGTATLGHAGRLRYRYLIHYVIYPGWDRRWQRLVVESGLASACEVARQVGAETGVMLLPVHPPCDPRLWTEICTVTYEHLATDPCAWTVLLGDGQVTDVWERVVAAHMKPADALVAEPELHADLTITAPTAVLEAPDTSAPPPAAATPAPKLAPKAPAEKPAPKAGTKIPTKASATAAAPQKRP